MMSKHIFSDVNSLVQALSDQLLRLSQRPELVHIALSGGSTPKAWFSYMAISSYREQVNWKNIHFWWVDERCVPAQHDQSNYGEAERLFLSKVLVPKENLHPIAYHSDAQTMLEKYQAEMSLYFPNTPRAISFDWILLGAGEDGHTASLFPGAADYSFIDSALIAKHPDTQQQRISLSAHTIKQAKRMSYVITGEGKAEICKRVIDDAENNLSFPAAKIRSEQGVTDWFLDESAAALLSKD